MYDKFIRSCTVAHCSHTYGYNSSTTCHECNTVESTMLKLYHAGFKASGIKQYNRKQTHLKCNFGQVKNIIKSGVYQ